MKRPLRETNPGKHIYLKTPKAPMLTNTARILSCCHKAHESLSVPLG